MTHSTLCTFLMLQTCLHGLDNFSMQTDQEAFQILSATIQEIIHGIEVDNKQEEQEEWKVKLCLLFLVKYLKMVNLLTDKKDNSTGITVEIMKVSDGYLGLYVDHWPEVTAELLSLIVIKFGWMDIFLQVSSS